MIPKEKVRKVLITRTATATLVSEDVVSKIINFQGKNANEAFKIHNEVELSGFGKFMVSRKKLINKLSATENGVNVLSEKEPTEENLEKLKGMKELVIFLKNKLKQYE